MLHETFVLDDVSRVTDHELVAGLRRLVRADRALNAQLLVHLGEVDARGLYRERAYPSMFAYCVEGLRMSEAQAYLRIQAARLSRQFPLILQLVAQGALNVSGIKLLGPHLTPDNHVALLEQARGKGKREVELLVAAIAPKPDVPSRIRKLPEPSAPPVVRLAAQDALQVALEPAVSSSPLASQTRIDASQKPNALPTVRGPKHSSFALEAPRPRGSSTPLSPGRYKVEFTAGQALHDKLAQLEDLLRHQVPDGDLAVLIERAVDLLIDHTMKRRFAQTNGRQMRRAAKPTAARHAGQPQTAQSNAAQPHTANSSTAEPRAGNAPTPQSTTSNACTAEPQTANPNTASSSTAMQHTTNGCRLLPHSANSSTAQLQTVNARTPQSTTSNSSTAEPQAARPHATNSSTAAQHTTNARGPMQHTTNARGPMQHTTSARGPMQHTANSSAAEAQMARPRTIEPHTTYSGTPHAGSASTAAASLARSARAHSSRYIPRAVVREVHQRDGGQCTFVSVEGKRCSERGFLELHHHDQPYARGGEATAENLRLVCRAHNALFAERDFGRAFMRSKQAQTRELIGELGPER